LSFNSDGTKLFIADRTNNVSEVQLSTAWDITTVSPLDIVETNRDNISPRGIALRGDEAKLFVVRNNALEIVQYDLAYGGDALASVQQP
jgi:DNA-binding beta-propeller fold protein YncE